ncbi:hypothetical protein HPO96_18115 [Kribbella sandramycini]|uniref:Uncharacterized protein n=1 Tax=Kribbella sandramycini TaxID=60450 RepID=A0A7Y4L0R8_9ACTN|nr:hypothetical protein [Kribbella sandramycini]
MVYGVVAAVLAAVGLFLPKWLADRSGPELGETVVITPGSARPTTGPPAAERGAGQVSPAPVRTAGDDDGPDDNDDHDADDGPDDDG